MTGCRQQGFTLIEILVVLLIVSVMSGVVIVNMPSMAQTGDFDTEVKRLNVLLELARDEALVKSSEMGFRPDRDSFGDLTGYSFLIYDDINQTWSNFDQSPFKPRKLTDGLELQLLLEGDDNQFRLGDDEEGLPPVMLLSSGETTPFELVIYREPDLSVTLRADGYSRIEQVDDDN